MASSKEYLHFALEQLSELDDISYRSMMGELILYYRGKIVGGIYDDRLLVKKTRSALELMPAVICELPYEGVKEMLLVDEVDSKAFLAELVEAMYDELFSLQSTHLCNMKQNGYQTAAFGYFSLMPFYAPVFYRGDNDYRNSIVSFCNTASFWLAGFSPHLLQNGKKHGII